MNKHTPQSEFQTPKVTTGPLPSSRKAYVAGDQYPDLRVPVREIDLHPTAEEPRSTLKKALRAALTRPLDPRTRRRRAL